MSDNIEKDDVTGVETTGHSWDGIKELNNPLPKWWVSLFYATILFSIGWTVAYPAWPMLTEHTKGLLGHSTRAALYDEMEAVRDSQSSWRDQIETAELTEILNDAELRRFATRAGAAAYAVNCSQCHGSGAQGASGYPNLNDDDWLWGGSVEQIHHTIAHGVRQDSDFDSRFSEMPAFGEWMADEEIDALTNSVLALAGLEHDAALAETGKPLFAEQCALCHGEQGLGGVDFGAPNLADAIWLFGGDAESIASQIRQPRHGAMPAWGQRLDDVTVKELAVYVHSLGGGQ